MSSFKLWRDGLVMAALIFGGGFLLLSSIGFETGWTLERWNGAVVEPHALHARFFPARRSAATLPLDLAMPRKQDEVWLITACDHYQTKYARGFGRITIDPLSTSKCPQERSLLAAFSQASRYKLGDGRMTLITSDGQILVFRRDGPF